MNTDLVLVPDANTVRLTFRLVHAGTPVVVEYLLPITPEALELLQKSDYPRAWVELHVKQETARVLVTTDARVQFGAFVRGGAARRGT